VLRASVVSVLLLSFLGHFDIQIDLDLFANHGARHIRANSEILAGD
jgi:hypothetical protein